MTGLAPTATPELKYRHTRGVIAGLDVASDNLATLIESGGGTGPEKPRQPVKRTPHRTQAPCQVPNPAEDTPRDETFRRRRTSLLRANQSNVDNQSYGERS